METPVPSGRKVFAPMKPPKSEGSSVAPSAICAPAEPSKMLPEMSVICGPSALMPLPFATKLLPVTTAPVPTLK